MPTSIDPGALPAAPDFSFETALWQQDICSVAGVDEAGRGALAGPVSAAAVIFPADPAVGKLLIGVDDSKRLTALQREVWAARLKVLARAWEVGVASQAEIDRLGIIPAVRLAITRAIRRLRVRPDHLLVDYLQLPDISIAHSSLVKGDRRSLSIAAASILAKTARDIMLRQLDLKYPGYGFAEHKGYGTAEHLDALHRLGPCPEHRLSFKLGRE